MSASDTASVLQSGAHLVCLALSGWADTPRRSRLFARSVSGPPVPDVNPLSSFKSTEQIHRASPPSPHGTARAGSRDVVNLPETPEAPETAPNAPLAHDRTLALNASL